MRESLALLGLRFRKQHGNFRDNDGPAIVKDPVAQGERADDAEPDLARLLRQVAQRLSELGVETQPAMKFFQCRQKRLAVAALSGNVRQGEQSLPHLFRIHHLIRHGFRRGSGHLEPLACRVSATISRVSGQAPGLGRRNLRWVAGFLERWVLGPIPTNQMPQETS